MCRIIGYYRITLSPSLKATRCPSFSYKIEVSFTCKLNLFSYEWLCTSSRFDSTEASLQTSRYLFTNQKWSKLNQSNSHAYVFPQFCVGYTYLLCVLIGWFIALTGVLCDWPEYIENLACARRVKGEGKSKRETKISRFDRKIVIEVTTFRENLFNETNRFY